MTQKSSASSRRAARSQSNGEPTRQGKLVRYHLDLDNPPALTPEQKARLDVLSRMSDDSIDFSDVPSLGAAAWEHAQVGRFYRPTKSQLTLRLDARVIDWFKRNAKNGKGYQTDINEALVEHIASKSRTGRKKAD